MSIECLFDVYYMSLSVYLVSVSSHFNISICQNVGEAGNVETVGKLKVVKNVDMLTCLNLKC